MYSVIFVIAIALFGFAWSEPHRRNASFVETVKEIVHDTSRAAGEHISENIAELGSKVRDGMEEFLDDTLEYMDDEENSTEMLGVDSTGCNRGLRKQLEDKCDMEYDKVNDEAQQIENEKEKIEAVCCALEDFEKCSLHAFDKSNCAADKAAIRENLKAARLFLSVVANITCTAFRGKCAYYASGAQSSFGFIPTLLVSTAFVMPLFKLF